MRLRVMLRRVPRWWFVALGFGVLMAFVVGRLLPYGVDWSVTYRTTALLVWSGHSPYEMPIFFNPPWTLLPMLPLALLPESLGRGAWFVISLAGMALALRRLGAKRWAFLAFMASPPVMHSLLNANIEWIPLLGYTLPPQIGLFFIMVKPQMGLVVALFWAYEAWRTGGLREVIRVFAPFVIVASLCVLIFGAWFLNVEQTLDMWWNASLWPLSIPVGLALAVTALRRRRVEFAMVASPCLSPYVLFHAWSGALAALARFDWEMVAAVVGLWGVVLLQSR